MIRVLIVDDHSLVSEALKTVLDNTPDIRVVGQAADGAAALQLCHALQPDLILMDIALPDISGIDLTQRLQREAPAVKILALSSHSEKSVVEPMLAAGAIGYISKAAGGAELLHGIRSAAAGQTYLSQNIAAMLVQPEPAEDEDQSAKLGKREIEVLKLVAEGLTSTQIAEQLHIAIGTVDVHRYNIMRKLDLHKVAELTKYAIRKKLISP